jgi:hypothetical protein
VVQPYSHPELDVLPLAKLEEQSKIEFNENKLDAKVKEYYSEFVAKKVDAPYGQALEIAD